MKVQQQLVKTEKKESDKELTGKALLSLNNRYSGGHGWSVFFEVSLKGRQADCIAFNIYPSRNFPIIGFEVKASRSDWTKELAHCEKAEPVVTQCDEYYIVEARKGIVRKDELPKGWGLLSLRGTRLYLRVKSKLDSKPKLSREFLARIVESSYLTGGSRYPQSVLYEAESRGYEKGTKAHKDTYEFDRLKERVTILDRLEKADISIKEWELEDIRKLRLALDFIKKLGGERYGFGIDKELNGSLRDCESAITMIKDAEGLIEKLRTEIGIKKLKR